MRLWPARKPDGARPGQPRLLVPFTDRQLDEAVLDAALRIARAEDAVLVPAYLLVVPLEFSLEAPVQHGELSRAMPILEAVELAARRGSSPRRRTHRAGPVADRRAPAPVGRGVIRPHRRPRTRSGARRLLVEDLAWMLLHGPGEILVLRPAPDQGEASLAFTTPTP